MSTNRALSHQPASLNVRASCESSERCSNCFSPSPSFAAKWHCLLCYGVALTTRGWYHEWTMCISQGLCFTLGRVVTASPRCNILFTIYTVPAATALLVMFSVYSWHKCVEEAYKQSEHAQWPLCPEWRFISSSFAIVSWQDVSSCGIRGIIHSPHTQEKKKALYTPQLPRRPFIFTLTGVACSVSLGEGKDG